MGEGEIDGMIEFGMSEWMEMEEEIIGNCWKELDYDGYYLVIVIFFFYFILFGFIGFWVRDGGKGV